jgi:hypothetical protein
VIVAWHGIETGGETPKRIARRLLIQLREQTMPTNKERALDSKARRAAARVGLKARKSRWRRDSIDNFGDFQLIDPSRNCVVAGSRFEMSAEDVIEYCSD